MTDSRDWRDISAEEAAVITAIVSQSGVPDAAELVDELDGAVAANETQWIIDVAPRKKGPGINIADGLFPSCANVSSNGAYQGEIIIWIKDGHLSGLEYAWITDEPPTRWPRPEDLEIAHD
jgi:hypothetical protein